MRTQTVEDELTLTLINMASGGETRIGMKGESVWNMTRSERWVAAAESQWTRIGEIMFARYGNSHPVRQGGRVEYVFAWISSKAVETTY